jgi:transposase InsO family protein
MKAEMSAQLVTDALLMAIWRRGRPDALLHHCEETTKVRRGGAGWPVRVVEAARAAG